MLLDLLEDTDEIRHMCILGRNCTLKKGSGDVECIDVLDKQIAEGKVLFVRFTVNHSSCMYVIGPGSKLSC